MGAVKLVFWLALAVTLSWTVSGALLDSLVPQVVSEFYNAAFTKESYRFNVSEPNGNTREEMGIIMNPGTEQEELVVMGTYSMYNEMTDTETITMYTADKTGYKPRYTFKKRKLSSSSLKAAAGK